MIYENPVIFFLEIRKEEGIRKYDVDGKGAKGDDKKRKKSRSRSRSNSKSKRKRSRSKSRKR